MAVQPSKNMKLRLTRVVMVVIAVVFIGLICNLFYVGILAKHNGMTFGEIAKQQQLSYINISPNRGDIYDRNMTVLAKSASVWMVVVSPRDVGETDDAALIASELARILGMNPGEIQEKLSKTQSQYEVVKRRIEQDVRDEINAFVAENEIRGVILAEDTKRYYPGGNFLSSVIGFTGNDNQGLYGIEKYYDEQLKGKEGRVVAIKDGNGQDMAYRFQDIYEPVDGDGLVLTIDETIQHFLEKALEDTVVTHKVENRACGIVMDVNTGEILAMATKPDYDLNEPFTIIDQNVADEIALIEDETKQQEARLNALEAQRTNKAITELYEPGSVFKVVTSSAALEEKTMTLSNTFSCSGVMNVAGTNIKCWKAGGHGSLDFAGSVVHSCNPAFIKIGQSLGADLFFKYFKAYGFTEMTGIDLPGEAAKTIFYTADKLGPVELASESFGQSMKITPIQMITMMSAAVNGGYLVEPHLLKQRLNNNGNVIETINTSVKRQVISKETSYTMREILEKAVTDGGGGNAYIKGYRIGGKSGTAQKLDGNETDRISSFVGFAPADDPKIAVMIMVDTPTAGEVYGSIVAAPAVSNIMSDVLPYLGIEPKYSQEEYETMDAAVPNVLGSDLLMAENKLKNSGLTYKIVGNGTTVVRQIPNGGAKTAKGSKIIIYTDESQEVENVIVPNVVGSTPSKANKDLTDSGLNILLKGGALNSDTEVMGQYPAAGSKVPKGTVVEVTYMNNSGEETYVTE